MSLHDKRKHDPAAASDTDEAAGKGVARQDSDQLRKDASGSATTQPEMPAVRPESTSAAPPSSPGSFQPRSAWLPPESTAVAPPTERAVTAEPPVRPSNPAGREAAGSGMELLPLSSRRGHTGFGEPQIFEEPEGDGDRETILSRDTVVSDLPPIEVERDRALLLRMDGPDAGLVISLTGRSLQIGRHPSTDVTINDRGISRIHARVYVKDGLHFIEDMGSSNGTLVQGERIDHSALREGDVIQLGPRVSFRYSLADSRHEELLRQLHRSSTRDALTGVYNRQHFTERLAAETAYAIRHHASVGVVMLDIDHFKQINDTYGHLVGDGVLCHVAATMGQRMRTEDVFARYGGEEFIALLRGAELRAAHQMAERMRVAISTQPAFVQEQRIPVTVSAGCAALACSPNPTPETLIAIADQRLYAAKRAGRNRVVSEG